MATHTTTTTVIRNTITRTMMMIMTASVSSSIIGVVGLGVGIEEVDSLTKTIAVIPSTWLM